VVGASSMMVPVVVFLIGLVCVMAAALLVDRT
jgi:hypothetical protein